MGSIVRRLPNVTSGMYRAHTTWAQARGEGERGKERREGGRERKRGEREGGEGGREREEGGREGKGGGREGVKGRGGEGKEKKG